MLTYWADLVIFILGWAGLVIFILGAVFMLVQAVLSVSGTQAAIWWPYGYQFAMATMVMGIGLMVTKVIV